MKEKFKILQVTTVESYFIPMHDEKITRINGWTLEEVIKDWFTTHGSLSYHATRDGHKIGNSRKFIKTEVTETIE